MRKRVCGLLLSLCLLLAGCGVSVQPQLPAEEPQEEQSEQAAVPMETEISVTVSDEGALLTPGQTALIRDLLIRWYLFIGSFEEQNFADLFDADHQEEALQHAASCRTLVAIRQAAEEDLHLSRCDITLTVTGVSGDGDGVRIDLDENTVMQFVGVAVESELFDLPHIFNLHQTDGDDWAITHHEADDNPYFSFTYEKGCETDPNLPLFLENIQRKQAQRGQGAPAAPAVDHPYDREGALSYMTAYCDHRNEMWHAYDREGGNCMNFASQVLLAGGIPMDYAGDAEWYWEGAYQTALSFINVGSFLEYARMNTGYGLVTDTEAPYYTGEIGDLVIFGVNSPRHMTEICGFVQDGQGNTVDYLLCSNTTNYRNFPAGAYYYTGQQLVKIYGWND